MNKGTPKNNSVDMKEFSKSIFILTFAIEILSMDVWHDCNEGWVDLGPYHQAMKLQYQLWPGKCFDLDILIWPHVVKIWCGNEYGYVRTWQYLERRWFTFSVRHTCVVRVMDLKNYIATVTCSMGGNNLSINAKNDKSIEAYLPPIKFGEQRYFGQVLEKEESLQEFFQNVLWSLVKSHIPASYMDGYFDVPSHVTDKRHQDAIIFNVQEFILKNKDPIIIDSSSSSMEVVKSKGNKKDSKVTSREKEKKKPIPVQKEKFTISLSGESILAGSGRIALFNVTGDRPPDQSNIIVLLSSKNLPAFDDLPIIFVTLEKLSNLPLEILKNARISQIYARWFIGDEKYESPKLDLKVSQIININDSYTVPLLPSKAAEITAAFLDDPFEIQIHGLIQNNAITGRNVNEDSLIAVTKMDLNCLSQMNNKLIRGEFPLFPPKKTLVCIRQSFCTNDINATKLSSKPGVVVEPFVILQAQMTLEVTLGLVGCKPKILFQGYSRFYCITSDLQASNAILLEIKNINERTKNREDVLTGFALSTKQNMLFYVEGIKDGPILLVWSVSELHQSKVLINFLRKRQYLDRIYAHMLMMNTPFVLLKTYKHINNLLACPQLYVQPALPLPARIALLKIGRLIATKFKVAPYKSEMPTVEELDSFKLELCVPPHFDRND